MTQAIVFDIGELRELKESSEKPENYILKPEDAATALDKDLYRRFLMVLSIPEGPFKLAVIYSITSGLKNEAPTLFRHASFKAFDHLLPVPLVTTACEALGFVGSIEDFHIEPHPQDPSIIAVFQEYQPG